MPKRLMILKCIKKRVSKFGMSYCSIFLCPAVTVWKDVYGPRVLKAGANGFLNKEMATEELVAAVHRVLAGRKYISGALAEKLAEGLNDTSGKAAHETLSDREMQVLQLLASGKTVSDVANELSLSVNTISTYRNRLLEKLTLHNNAELTRYELDNNLA